MSKDQHQLMATLVQFLRLSWIAATLPIIIASIPIPKLNFLRQILLLFAKRGKITHSSSSSSQVTTLFIFIHLTTQKYHLFTNGYLVPLKKFDGSNECFFYCRSLLFLRDSFCISMLWLQYGQCLCLLQLGCMLIEWCR